MQTKSGGHWKDAGDDPEPSRHTFMSSSLWLEQWKGRAQFQKSGGQEGKKNPTQSTPSSKCLIGANGHSVHNTKEEEWVGK